MWIAPKIFCGELKKIIRAKAKGKLKYIKEPEERIEATKVEDILDALKKSLKEEPVPIKR